MRWFHRNDNITEAKNLFRKRANQRLSTCAPPPTARLPEQQTVMKNKHRLN
jgi:hypothetical protein